MNKSEGNFDIIKFANQANLDLSSFSEDFIKKRIISFCNGQSLSPISLAEHISKDAEIKEKFINSLSVLVSDFFRDPEFYKHLELKAIEWLQTFPLINIWCVGCATGEEPISVAIWLKRNGLLNRSTIYATDISTDALEIAKSASYSKLSRDRGEENYLSYCNQEGFQDFFSTDGELVSEIKERITYHDHNCLFDAAFCQAQIIFCRNVLIYYNEPAQYKILQLLKTSLEKNAFLCLGKVEHVPFEWRKSLSLKRIECEGKVYRSY